MKRVVKKLKGTNRHRLRGSDAQIDDNKGISFPRAPSKKKRKETNLTPTRLGGEKLPTGG